MWHTISMCPPSWYLYNKISLDFIRDYCPSKFSCQITCPRSTWTKHKPRKEKHMNTQRVHGRCPWKGRSKSSRKLPLATPMAAPANSLWGLCPTIWSSSIFSGFELAVSFLVCIQCILHHLNNFSVREQWTPLRAIWILWHFLLSMASLIFRFFIVSRHSARMTEESKTML